LILENTIFFAILSFLKNLDLAKVSLLGLKEIRGEVMEISASLSVKEQEDEKCGPLLNWFNTHC